MDDWITSYAMEQGLPKSGAEFIQLFLVLLFSNFLDDTTNYLWKRIWYIIQIVYSILIQLKDTSPC